MRMRAKRATDLEQNGAKVDGFEGGEWGKGDEKGKGKSRRLTRRSSGVHKLRRGMSFELRDEFIPT